MIPRVSPEKLPRKFYRWRICSPRKALPRDYKLVIPLDTRMCPCFFSLGGGGRGGLISAVVCS